MLRQIFASAAPSARLANPITTTTLKTQLTHSPTWHIPNTTTILRSARLFTTTSAVQNVPFRPSPSKYQEPLSPFRDEDPYSQYPPKRQWPPDMSKLSPKHQFRLERKYRRRAALKYARPKFMKMVTLAQWLIIGFVAVYAVLFMNWDTRDTPFDGLRESIFDAIKGVFTTPPPPQPKKSDESN
ncbi:hypothetical protein N7456_009409 [Penicillium angulare]|uniref:Uncharacterized protein n=1 Tax=Penicillium angulare TaxID=116970 RepID=A0A9W9F4K5_9EURO|nr:hypothetical protein N7456_009409 [Penicillium angulare]